MATLLVGGVAFVAGLVAGDRLRQRTAELTLAWRTSRGPVPQQGYKRQGDIPGRTAAPTPEQRREIEALRSMAYVSATRQASGAAGVTTLRRELAWPGLNLVVDTHGPEAVLLDMDGRPVHAWRHDFRGAFPDSPIRRGAEGIQYWRRVALLGDGGVLAIFEGAGLVRLDRDSKLLWAFAEAAHHDLEVQADGRIYVLTRRAGLRPEIHPDRPVTEDWVVVLDPQGGVLRRVSVLEAIRRSDFSRLLELTEGHGDLLHTNTVEVLDGSWSDRLPAFAAGNVLLSFPKIDTLAVLDMERESIVWSLTGMTRYQHEPTVLASGRLLVFDNWVFGGGLGARANVGRTGGGEGAGGRYSRVVEIDPLRRTIEWSFGAPPGADAGRHFYTECCGAGQRLANGNTLITETDRGRAFEITPDGDLVWEYRTPHRVGEGDDELVARLFEVRRVERAAVATWLPGSE